MITSTIPLPLPLVYVAGPYSAPTPEAIWVNVCTAMDVGDALDDSGVCRALIPHVSHFRHMRRPRDYKEWLAIDTDLLLHCDAVLRIPGASNGADGEVVIASKLVMPVLYTVGAVLDWARARK